MSERQWHLWRADPDRCSVQTDTGVTKQGSEPLRWRTSSLRKRGVGHESRVQVWRNTTFARTD